MNLSEIAIVLEEGVESQNERMIIHADMKASVLNAPHFTKKDHKPCLMQEFIPKNLVKSLKREITPEEQARRIKEKGDAQAAKCRMLKER